MRSIRYTSLSILCALAWIAMPCLLWWGTVPVARVRILEGISQKGEPTYLSIDGRYLATVKKHFEEPTELSVTIPYEKPVDLPQTISIWDLDTGSACFEQREPNVSRMFFSPDAKRMVVVWIEGEVRVWNTMTSEVCVLPHPAFSFGHATLSPDGHVMAAAGSAGVRASPVINDQFRFWDLTSMKEIMVIERHPGPFDVPMTFSPDGQQLAVSGPARVQLLNWATQEPSVVLTCLSSLPDESVFAPDGQTLAVQRRGSGELAFIDIASQQLRDTWKIGSAVEAIAYAPDSKLIAVSAVGVESKLRELVKRIHTGLADRICPLERRTVLLDAQTGRRLELLPPSSHVAFRPDGKTLVTYSKEQDAVLLWDVPPRPRISLVAHMLSLLLSITLTALWWRARRIRHKLVAKSSS